MSFSEHKQLFLLDIYLGAEFLGQRALFIYSPLVNTVKQVFKLIVKIVLLLQLSLSPFYQSLELVMFYILSIHMYL